MRIATYVGPAGDLRAGLVSRGVLVDAAEAARAAGLDAEDRVETKLSVRQMLRKGEGFCTRLADSAARIAAGGGGLQIDGIQFAAPVPDPDKIICVGLNYADHAVEFEADTPRRPVLFAKFATSLIGSGQSIRRPPVSAQIDWEGELAVVIGRECHAVSEADAMDFVAGCMPFNDVTARDLQMETSQWLAGKALDTFAPCGPALVSLDEIRDVQDITLTTRVNDQVVQHSSTRNMIFSVAEIISFVSRLMTLNPGDIIATGTPEGVGFRRNPPWFLISGDVVEVELEGIGCLVNPVTDAVLDGQRLALDGDVAGRTA